VSRRTVASGAVWAVPTIAVGAAAPAVAASACPTIPTFGAANGWSLSTTGAGVPGSGSARFSGGSFVCDTDAAALSTYTATASRGLPVLAGVQYTFLLSFTALVTNPRPMTLRLSIGGTALSPTPLVDTGALSPNGGSSTNHTGTRTASWVAPTDGTVTLALTVSISSTLLTTAGDDITVTSLSVACG
jgi:hypothetical protein